MRRWAIKAALVTMCVLLAATWALADSTEKWLKDLKSDNPDIRAKAAHELGCG